MIKLKIVYQGADEKERLISSIKNKFNIVNKSKEYPGQEKSPYTRLYMDLSNK